MNTKANFFIFVCCVFSTGFVRSSDLKLPFCNKFQAQESFAGTRDAVACAAVVTAIGVASYKMAVSNRRLGFLPVVNCLVIPLSHPFFRKHTMGAMISSLIVSVGITKHASNISEHVPNYLLATTALFLYPLGVGYAVGKAKRAWNNEPCTIL